MFNNNIILPTAKMNVLIELDRYICATDEERLSDEFKWHRENLLHEDDVTFYVPYLGSVHTYGKSIFDNDANWSFGIKYERVGAKSWKLNANQYYEDSDDYAIVTYEGRNADGKNVYSVEAYCTDTCQTSYPDGDEITAIAATSGGPMTIIEPKYIRTYDINPQDFPLGKGIYRVDTQRNGEPLDWLELHYSDNGDAHIFKSNL